MSSTGVSSCTACAPVKYSLVQASDFQSCHGGVYALLGRSCDIYREGTFTLSGASLCSGCENGKYRMCGLVWVLEEEMII